MFPYCFDNTIVPAFLSKYKGNNREIADIAFSVVLLA